MSKIKWRLPVIATIAGIVLVIVGIVALQNIYSGKTASYNGAYEAHYNRFTGIMTIDKNGEDVRWHFLHHEEPTFFLGARGESLGC